MSPSDSPSANESTPAPSSVAVADNARPSGPGSARVIAVLVGVFAFGVVAGGFAGRAFTLSEFRKTISGPPGEQRARWRIEAMKREMDLSDQQITQIGSIMKAGEPDREAAMKACKPEVDALRERTDAQILEVLTPAQRPKYTEFVKRRQQR